jgi:alpha-mannosidase
MYREARGFLAPPQLVAPAGREGRLPRRHTFLEITSDPPHAFVLSALKHADEREALIVRLFNPGPEPVRARVAAAEPLRAAHETDLGEKRGAALEIREGRTEITLPPHAIRTLSLEMSSPPDPVRLPRG